MQTHLRPSIRVRVSTLVALAALLMSACAPRAATTPSAPTVAVATDTAPASTPAAPATPAASTDAPQATATPALVPTKGPDAPATTDDLAKVKSAGKISVGTSADYPPYAFYNSQYKVDGFDVALINDIAKRMGVQADMNDFAFEGVLPALQLGQVDVVIAAIVPNDQRRQLADFSRVYFIGADAVLASKASSVGTLGSLAELAGKKVGAQRGTVYATFLKEELVGKGLSTATDIFEYLDPSEAIKDLIAKKIDFLMIDRLPARAFAQTRDVKVVGENFNPQRFSIAVRKGSNLRDAINDALLQSQNDGTVQKLIQQYLNLNPSDVEPIPPPTSEPTPIPGPTPTAAPPACVDGMAWVADLTFDDQNMTAPAQMQPGQGFAKSWRVRNAGNCNWAADYTLRFIFGNVAGADMGGRAIAIGRAVNPGELVDLSVNLIAPAAAGTYQGFWQMYNSAGAPFGERVWAGIVVPGAPTPVPPPPTAVPLPGGVVNYFTVDNTTITVGQGVTFRWDAQNVRAVYFYLQGQDYRCCGRPGTSVETVYPQASGTWELRVERNDGGIDIRNIYINVTGSGIEPAPPSGSGGIGPTTVNIYNVTPNGGGCVNIQWQITGQLASLAISRDGQILPTPQSASGSFNDCPGTGSRVYALVASAGNGNAVSTSRTVSVY